MTVDARTAMQLRNAGIRPESLPAGAKIDGKAIGATPAENVRVEVCPNGTVRIVIPGPAPGKPRMVRSDKWRKRPATSRYWAWANRIKADVGNSIPAAELVTELRITAFYEPPGSWSKKRRVAAIGTRHRSKPDGSNILKGVEDCLWPDNDSAIADIVARKRWDWVARLEVEIIIDKPEAIG